MPSLSNFKKLKSGDLGAIMSTIDQLRDYQVEAIKFCLKHHRTYLALDMGLGKTAITLTVIANALHKYENMKAFLVIAPIRTINTTWPEEIRKWRPELTYTILHGPDKDVNLLKKKQIYIINYEGLPWLFESLKLLAKSRRPCPFNGLAIDEGSMVKSHKTTRFDLLDKMRKLFPKFRLILSGTPAPNSEHDLWSQYYILDDGYRLDTSITRFRKEFCSVDYTGHNYQPLPHKVKEIHAKVADITYRLDSADHLKLPERIYNNIHVELPKKAHDMYLLVKKKKPLIINNQEVEINNAMAQQSKLRQIVQGAVYINEQHDYEVIHKAKIDILKSLVEEAAGNGILCAIQFRFELEMIQKVFPKVPFVARGTTMEQTQQYIKDWNLGKIPLLLAHPASIGHGMNMQYGSNLIVWYGIPWSLELYLQLNKRLHRLGQLKTVIIHHLVCKGTVDEVIMNGLQLKNMNQTRFLDYQKAYMKYVHVGGMSEEDFIKVTKSEAFSTKLDQCGVIHDAIKFFLG